MLAAGDFLEIGVFPDQVLVTLSLREADGTLHRTANAPDIHPLPERIVHLAGLGAICHRSICGGMVLDPGV